MLPKLHLITAKDETRPANSCIQITKQDLRASDFHALAIIPTERTMPVNCDNLPDYPIYLHADNYKLLTAPSIAAIAYDADKELFVAYHSGSKPSTVVPLTNLDERFPDFTAYEKIKWEVFSETSYFGLNPKKLLNLAEAIAAPGQKNLSTVVRTSSANFAYQVKLSEGDLASLAVLMGIFVQDVEALANR